jgi:hypothetical protein
MALMQTDVSLPQNQFFVAIASSMRYVTRRLPLGQYRPNRGSLGPRIGRLNAPIVHQTVDAATFYTLK